MVTMVICVDIYRDGETANDDLRMAVDFRRRGYEFLNDYLYVPLRINLGAITVLFGILTMFFLPNTPGHARFLSEEERYGAMRRMKLDAHGATTASDIAAEKFSWAQVRLALLNWNTILLSLNFFAIITP